MSRKRRPETVLILAATRDEVGWSLQIEHDYAGQVLPVLGKPKRRKKTVPVEIELHMPDRTVRVSAKCARVLTVDKESV